MSVIRALLQVNSLRIEALVKLLFGFCALMPVLIFFYIFYAAINLGSDAISWQFLVEPSLEGGLSGGVLYQIIGSLVLVVSTAFFVAPLAIVIALTHKVTSKIWLKKTLGIVLQASNVTPSILFGIMGFIAFVKELNLGKSWLGGSIILSLMILPTVAMTTLSRLETIPKHYLETAYSLGFHPSRIILKILLPYCLGGFVTGMFMGLARALGETAPIMYTAVVFYGAQIPEGIIDSPVLALPYHIYNLAQDVMDPRSISKAWATAVVLLMMVFGLSATVGPLRAKLHEEAKV